MHYSMYRVRVGTTPQTVHRQPSCIEDTPHLEHSIHTWCRARAIQAVGVVVPTYLPPGSPSRSHDVSRRGGPVDQRSRGVQSGFTPGTGGLRLLGEGFPEVDADVRASEHHRDRIRTLVLNHA